MRFGWLAAAVSLAVGGVEDHERLTEAHSDGLHLLVPLLFFHLILAAISGVVAMWLYQWIMKIRAMESCPRFPISMVWRLGPPSED